MKHVLLFLTIPLLLNAGLDTPSNLVLTPTDTSVTLQWQDNSDSETGFKIFRDEKLIMVTQAGVTSYTDSGLTPNTAYTYTLKATDENKLLVDVVALEHGIRIQSIKDGAEDIINPDVPTSLFNFSIEHLSTQASYHVLADSGWGNVTIQESNALKTITLKNPTDANLPSTLEAIITIKSLGGHTEWDLQLKGVGNKHTINDVTFPHLAIQPYANDTFFLPYHFGQEVKNPATSVDKTLLYPRGWGATMQYLAYYHDNHGVYLGFHDSKAALKTFQVHHDNASISLSCDVPAPNKTLANNDFQFPGYFSLDVLQGAWYEAAQKYKSWVYQEADYAPENNLTKRARAEKIGSIGVWVLENIREYNMSDVENHVRDFKNYMDDGGIDIPVGVHWSAWSDMPFDYKYPEIFPPLDGFANAIGNLKKSFADGVMLSAYFNGRLYDTEHLSSYNTMGEPYATKDSSGSVWTQTFGHIDDETGNWENTIFAIMCPTQKPWQDIVVNAVTELTSLGLDSVYIDQVTAAAPTQCMDPTHGHTLGGGNYWREGYHDMFASIHASIEKEKFILSEGANDFLVDEVDGFLTEMFVVNNQVPAFQAVYAGKVQFIGPSTGWSSYNSSDEPDSERFYGRLAQSFSFGVQPGRFYMGLAWNQNERGARAAQYLKRLARMRVKLKNFLSFGEMLKPLTLSGDIPTISFIPGALGEDENTATVEIPAIQTATWRDDESILLTFVNGKVLQEDEERISFGFDFDSTLYGIDEAIAIKEITEDGEGDYQTISNQFHKDVTLAPYEVKAFVITPLSKIE